MLSAQDKGRSIPTQLPATAIARLDLAMAQWRAQNWEQPETADAFRYEMVAGRLQAAADGVPRAVEWAWHWFLDLAAEDAQALTEQQMIASQRADIAAHNRAEICAGRSNNARLQAFLDTLEDPAGEMYGPDGTFEGWKYLVWISPLIGEAERSSKCPRDPRERERFAYQFVQTASARQRAARLGGPLHSPDAQA
ncbi:hypothetical protein [Rubrivivax gelatinosus]|uniref:hypothetical protein n=1 Tax=Rubrivivax gelatinosus TaxID=28068 RepID=UPI0005C21B31|nr:hypothetical protein [Rubrivivax gelatinosus]MBG6083068.1 hypothetical protein [Rubrivivax gelatinosus]